MIPRSLVVRGGGMALTMLMLGPEFPGRASAQEPKKVSIVMGAGAFYFIVHYVAEAGGYYKEEGVRLDSVNVGSGPRQVAAIMGGSADVGPLGLQLVVEAAQHDGGMMAICSGYTILPMGIVLSNQAMKKNGIRLDMTTDEKVHRMKGLRIGITTPGSGTDDMVRALLRKAGMNASTDITIQSLVNAEGMVAALQRGESDGFCFTSPINEMVVAQGLGQIVIEPLRGDVPEASNVPYIIMATSRETIASKRPLLMAMVRAWTKAMTMVHADPKRAGELVKTYFPKVPQDVFDTAYNKYVAGVPKTPMITPEQVDNVVKFMKLSKGTAVSATYSGVVDPSFAEAVIKSEPGIR